MSAGDLNPLVQKGTGQLKEDSPHFLEASLQKQLYQGASRGSRTENPGLRPVTG